MILFECIMRMFWCIPLRWDSKEFFIWCYSLLKRFMSFGKTKLFMLFLWLGHCVKRPSTLLAYQRVNVVCTLNLRWNIILWKWIPEAWLYCGSLGPLCRAHTNQSAVSWSTDEILSQFSHSVWSNPHLTIVVHLVFCRSTEVSNSLPSTSSSPICPIVHPAPVTCIPPR